MMGEMIQNDMSIFLPRVIVEIKRIAQSSNFVKFLNFHVPIVRITFYTQLHFDPLQARNTSRLLTSISTHTQAH